MSQLTGKQKRILRGLAQELEPILEIGAEGLTDEAIATMDAALGRHELIVVELREDAPLGKREANDEIRRRTRCEGIQQTARLLVFYKAPKGKSLIDLPPGGGRGRRS